jgi:hypothetical protein
MWNSAKEYADLVKIEEYEYSAEPDDLEVRKSMLSERYSDEIIWRRYDPDFEHTPTETKYQHIISGLMVQFCATLSDEQQINFLSRFYWTTIDNRHNLCSLCQFLLNHYFNQARKTGTCITLPGICPFM